MSVMTDLLIYRIIMWKRRMNRDLDEDKEIKMLNGKTKQELYQVYDNVEKDYERWSSGPLGDPMKVSLSNKYKEMGKK